MKRELLDPKTGEIVEVLLIGRDPAHKDKDYVKVFVAFLRDVVQKKEIAGKAIRLLLYMVDRLDWNTLEVWLIPSQVAKDLGVDKRTFHRWIGDLIKVGYIQKLGRYRYRLKPYSVIRGSMHKVEEVDF